MDRERWKKWVSYPSWPCPACQNGNLRLIPDTMKQVASRKERLDQSDPEHYHAETLNRFVALMKCDARHCGETATLAGNYYSHWVNDGSEEGHTDISYEVLSLIPSPLPFKIAKKVPKAIEDVIREAATLFWIDPKAAANRSREAIEAILTDLGIPTLTAKEKPMHLGKRIDLFAEIEDGKWAEQADIIEAAKWIGNEGTHATIDREMALDAFDMLETVIDDIYVRSRHALMDKVKATNEKHRPPSKKQGSA